MIINFKGMENVMVQGDDKSRMRNALQNNNRMGRGNQGRNIQTLPASQYEGSIKVSETRDSSLQVLATNGNQFPNLQTNLMNVNAGFFDDVSSFILSPFQKFEFLKNQKFYFIIGPS